MNPYRGLPFLARHILAIEYAKRRDLSKELMATAKSARDTEIHSRNFQYFKEQLALLDDC